MKMNAEGKDHFERLGRLVANMQSFELALRIFHHNDELANGLPPPSKVYSELKAGDIVKKDAFTNWDTLQRLTTKYNKDKRVISSDLIIDEDLVNIRDAIAHGRIASTDPSITSKTLLKFKRPIGDTVEVEYSTVMSREWLNEQMDRFHYAIRKVIKSIGEE